MKLWGVGVRGGSGASEKCRGAKADFNATTGKWVGEGNLKGGQAGLAARFAGDSGSNGTGRDADDFVAGSCRGADGRSTPNLVNS